MTQSPIDPNYLDKGLRLYRNYIPNNNNLNLNNNKFSINTAK